MECERRLRQIAPDMRFHVVGNFSETDAPPGVPLDRVRFHGQQPAEFFPTFYSEMDVIVAPN